MVRSIKKSLDPLRPLLRQSVKDATGNKAKAFVNEWLAPDDYKRTKESDSTKELWNAAIKDPKLFGSPKVKKALAKNIPMLTLAGRTGLLSKSMNVKAKAGKRKAVRIGNKTRTQASGKAYGMAGAEKLMMLAVSPFTKKLIMAKPKNYGRLVERGHILKIRGVTKGRVKPYPFIEPVASANMAQVATRLATYLGDEINKAAGGA